MQRLLFLSFFIFYANCVVLSSSTSISSSISFNSGDIFIATGDATIKRFSDCGALIQIIDANVNSPNTGQAILDGNGNLYLILYDLSIIAKFDGNGNLIDSNFIECVSGSVCESLTVDNNLNIYVIQEVISAQLLEFSYFGTQFGGVSITIPSTGNVFIALSYDQCTMYLTFSTTSNYIAVYDVCQNLWLDNYLSNLPNIITGIVTRYNGEVFFSTLTLVYRYDINGNFIQIYNIPICAVICNIVTIEMNIDGNSFWIGDSLTNTIQQIDILTGDLLKQFVVETTTSGLSDITIFKGLIIELTTEEDYNILMLGETITFDIQVDCNQIQCQNITIIFSVSGANGPVSFQLITDMNGFATYSYTGLIAGLDTVNVTIPPIIVSNTIYLNWQPPDCTVGDAQCLNNLTFQLCVEDDTNNSTYFINQTCYSDQVCQNLGNTISCIPNSIPPSSVVCDPYPVPCDYGYMQCLSTNTYETCDYDLNGNLNWDIPQSCLVGQTCHQIGYYIYCY